MLLWILVMIFSSVAYLLIGQYLTSFDWHKLWPKDAWDVAEILSFILWPLFIFWVVILHIGFIPMIIRYFWTNRKSKI
jgi:hypothetical protein